MQLHDWRQWAGSRRRPYCSPEQLREYQERKLAQLIRSAGRQVPFYQRRFEEAGLDPSQIRSLADIGRIPPRSATQSLVKPNCPLLPIVFY